MDRNLLLAVALSVAVYAAWFGFIEKKVNPQPDRLATSYKRVSSSPSTGASDPANFGTASTGAGDDHAPLKLDAAEADTVNIGDIIAKVHPRGAAIVSYQSPEPLGLVELVHDPEAGMFATFSELTFARDAKVKNGIVYTATRADGLKIQKEFMPGNGTVLPRVNVVLINPTKHGIDSGAWTLSVGPGLGTIATEKKENQKLQRAIALTPGAAGLNGHVEKLQPGEHSGPFRWIGIDNRYFLAALVPSPELFGAAKTELPPKVTLTAKPVNIPPNGSFTWEVPFYLGAKDKTLPRYNIGLERAIDFGFFSWIGRRLLQALEHLHGITGNWGWSILILTLCLQALLFPLTWKSLRAAAAMKKLQPEVAKLQLKYADDSAKLSAATMELYKTKGANPLGGCLPMVLQMPIFIALFNALRNSWELHGAPWTLWIHDLSAKDPYYVLPIVMGGLMFLQSKLNPPAGDKSQQQVMMFMPLIFTFMFMNFPAGLVLYWLTNSLVSTVVQLTLKDQLEA
jgi:YidC/Oxa1 family membrane protein insertase